MSTDTTSGADPAGPPPGWYVDPSGGSRWWDGTGWGPTAPDRPGGGGSNSRTLATLAHLGAVFGSFVVPLVIYLSADPRDRYVRHHAREGLGVWWRYPLSIRLVRGAP